MTMRRPGRRVVLTSTGTSYGGAERVLMTLARGLPASGWEPIVAHVDEPGLAPLAAAAHALDIPTRTRAAGRPGIDLGRLPGDAAWLRRVRPDVVHLHLGWPGAGIEELAAAAVARVPVIVVSVHLYIHPPRRRAIAHRALSRAVAAYIAVSDGVSAALGGRLGLPRTRIIVVPNGIDTEPFAGARAAFAERPPPDLPKGTDGPLVVTVAQLRRQKAIDVLIDAAASLPGVRFAVLGDGPERVRLERQVTMLGLGERVALLGFRDDVVPYLGAAAAFALPSRAEGLPLAAMEAMAAGLPVVATDVDGTREVVVDGQTGMLVPPGDAAALARTLDGVVREPLLAQRLGQAGARRVQDLYRADQMVRRTADLYLRLLGGSSPR